MNKNIKNTIIFFGAFFLMKYAGMDAVIPPILTILLAILTKDVVFSLVTGIFTGAFLLKGNIFSAFSETTSNYIVNSLGNSDHASIIIFSMVLGGMISVISCSGGTRGIVELIIKYARTRKMVKLSTWLMGILIFFDDYANTLIVGNTMRPLTDKMKISREKLAYIVDSTAAPVASLALISTWIGMEVGLLNDAFQSAGIPLNGFKAFLSSVPFRFYSMFTLFFIFVNIITGKDYGPMYQAEKRAFKTGKVISDNACPLTGNEMTELGEKADVRPRWYNAVIPILFLIIFTLWGLYYTGLQSLRQSDPLVSGSLFSIEYLKDILGASNSFSVLIWASFLSSIIILLIGRYQGIFSLSDGIESWITGVRSMLRATMILVLAWAIGKVCSDLGTAEYVASLAGKVLNPSLVPFVSFVLAGIIAFSTGTSWGTMSILIPVCIPIAHKLSLMNSISSDIYSNILYGTIGAVLAGASWGDHCSPISDTTIMSSMATSSDHIDHVRTQLPYAVTCAVIALLAGYLPSGYGISPWVTIPSGMVLIYLVIKIFGKKL